MPGAGKTTAVVELGRRLGVRCLAVPELNPRPNRRAGDEQVPANRHGDRWAWYHAEWVERLALLGHLAQFEIAVLDRSHLSTLACSYARQAAYGETAFGRARAAAARAIPRAPYDLVVVLRAEPAIGLTRRLATHVVPWPWADHRFLAALAEFYCDVLPAEYAGSVVEIDTNTGDERLVQDQLEVIVRQGLMRSRVEAAAPANERQVDRRLLAAGASLDLGAPYGLGFHVAGFATRYFRQHALQLRDGRPVLEDEWLTMLHLLEGQGARGSVR